MSKGTAIYDCSKKRSYGARNHGTKRQNKSRIAFQPWEELARLQNQGRRAAAKHRRAPGRVRQFRPIRGRRHQKTQENWWSAREPFPRARACAARVRPTIGKRSGKG